MKSMGSLLKETFTQWINRDPFRNSTVIAYYTIFSLPGLLIIIINLTGYFFEQQAVSDEIDQQIRALVGNKAAQDVQTIVSNASESSGFTLSSIISLATLLFGATGVFYQLQQTLNLMWEVKPQPKRKLLKLVMDRLFSFGLILVVGFLLLVSLVLSTVLSMISNWVAAYFSDSLNIVFRLLDISVSLSVITLLFAAIYKFLPDAEIEWRDVWIGALVTSLLFVLAKFALGLYFAYSDPGSTYGAAGSIILIMLWVSYAGMILFFGAEFTRVYARHHGRRIVPSDYAVSTAAEAKHPDSQP
ncbi:YihY/virulence factor BrkB family protein [Cellvibrio sp. ARAG 10.3]|uniref:YihY/virulence factor BrkB family protein n=1 Tax=Cellvibrio sp. ARAG 10.3 TaxID=3451358 RepID=UPI003F473682